MPATSRKKEKKKTHNQVKCFILCNVELCALKMSATTITGGSFLFYFFFSSRTATSELVPMNPGLCPALKLGCFERSCKKENDLITLLRQRVYQEAITNLHRSENRDCTVCPEMQVHSVL